MSRTRTLSSAPDCRRWMLLTVCWSLIPSAKVVDFTGQRWGRGGRGGKMFAHRLYSPSLAHCRPPLRPCFYPFCPLPLWPSAYTFWLSLIYLGLYRAEHQAGGNFMWRHCCFGRQCMANLCSSEQDFLLAWLLWGHTVTGSCDLSPDTSFS